MKDACENNLTNILVISYQNISVVPGKVMELRIVFWLSQKNWEKLEVKKVSLLTDLSKAFDCIPHNLLIAKLSAYGFDRKSLPFISAHLKSRKQKTRIGSAFSDYLNILFGAPQGSILGPIYLSLSCLICFIFTLIWTTRAMLMTPLFTYADRIMLKLLNFYNWPLTIYLLRPKIMELWQIQVKQFFWLVRMRKLVWKY